MAKRCACLALLAVLLGLVAVAAEPEKPKAPVVKDPTNLVRNGNFEEGDANPTGWQTVDGLSTFWVKDDDPAHGRVLKIDTDILQSQAYDWWTQIAKGALAKDAPKKIASKDPNKYDTLAGNDGVWFWSDPLPVEQGKAYWLTVDARGPGGGLLAWLVGYPDKPNTAFGADAGAFQEYLQGKTTAKAPDRGRGFESFIKKYKWRGQLSSLAQSDPGKWKTFARREKPFRPTVPYPDVRFVRVLLYAYWPPGVYYFDNVKVVEVEDK
jgi:hypothetical protein